MPPNVLELCCGTGRQILGFEAAGYRYEALVHADRWTCDTVRQNRPNWNVVQADLCYIDTTYWHGMDVVAGGLSCIRSEAYVKKPEEAEP